MVDVLLMLTAMVFVRKNPSAGRTHRLTRT
jgi:hypothetical protein